MGLLEKLFKIIAGEVVSNISENKTVQATPQPKPANVKTVYQTDVSYFETLLNSDNFPEYEIEKNVSLSVFDSSAHPKCFPITFLFKKSGSPVLAVFIMKEPQRNTMPVAGSKMILDENNVPYLRFYIGWENEKNYVLNRIKENL